LRSANNTNNNSSGSWQSARQELLGDYKFTRIDL